MTALLMWYIYRNSKSIVYTAFTLIVHKFLLYGLLQYIFKKLKTGAYADN